MTTNFRKIKSEIRILGIDDAPFKFKSRGDTLLIGTIYRGGEWPDGVLSVKIKVDGTNSTSRITSMVNKTRHKDQLRVIMLDGITFGGMNLTDIQKIYKNTNVPVIVVNRKKPNFKNIENALKNFKDFNQRWKKIENAGEVYKIKVKEHNLYIQTAGIKLRDATEIVKLSCTRSHIPEALRVSHLIARGVVLGESKGRA